MPDACIYWLHDLGQEHNDLVGKKCANLGEMTRLGMQVPPGFALSVDAYRKYMDLTGSPTHRRLLRYARRRPEAELLEASRRELLRAGDDSIHAHAGGDGDKIERSYDELCERCRTANVPVAVRSSGAVSMPGQMETYLHVRGSAEVKRRVVEVGRAPSTRARSRSGWSKGWPSTGAHRRRRHQDGEREERRSRPDPRSADRRHGSRRDRGDLGGWARAS